MTKPIYSWIKYVVACAVMIGVAWGARAQRFIYYCGDYNGWSMPIESNEADFEDFKLYETADGSNIYSGVVKVGANHNSRNPYQYFTFFTKLSSDEDYSNGLHPLAVNRLVPQKGYNQYAVSAEECPAAYKVGFDNPPYKSFDYTSADYTPETWFIRMPDLQVPVKFIVDFNEKTVSAIFDTNVLVVNDNARPTIDNINDFSFNGKEVYVPQGECRFRAYNLFKDKYYSLPEATEVKGTWAFLNSESDAFCTIPNWGGGILSISVSSVYISNRYQSLNSENLFKDWGETAYLVGSFTDWGFEDEYRMEYVDGIFYGKIPAHAGNTEFKITAQPTWNALNAGEISKTIGGNTTFFTPGMGAACNFSIDNVVEEMNVSFEPARQAVKIWPASQGAPDPEPEGLFSDGTTIPVIPKFTGIVLDRKDMFVDLTKVAPSEVGIGNLTAFKFTGDESKYEFALGGGLKEPFRFLEFKDDKLIRVIQPANDVTLRWVRDIAHGSITTATDADEAYWTSEEEGKTTVTIDPQSNDLNAITFRMPSLIEPAYIYLVGSMNNWNTDEAYNSYSLKQTDDNKFYGAFDIPAGKVELKFLKDLNGWGGITPIGAPDYSSPDFMGTYLNIPVTSNYDNSWNISFYNYDPGTIYMLVDDKGGNLLLSRVPLDVKEFEGNVGEPDGVLLIDSANGDRRYEAREVSDGVYIAYLYGGYSYEDITHRIKIIRDKHTFSKDEPTYTNSYTLTFADTKLIAGEDGVAETSFTFNEGVNAGAGNEIEINPTKYRANATSYAVVIDFNDGKIYFDDTSCSYMVGSHTGNRVPTYATRKDFADWRLHNGKVSMILDLPAGEASLKLISLASDMTYVNNDTAEATFDSDGVAKTDYSSTIFYPGEVILHNCPGGKIFVSPHQSLDERHCSNFYLLALDKIKTFDVVSKKFDWTTQTYSYTPYGQLTLTDESTRTFSGRVSIPKEENAYYSYFDFTVNSDKDFAFGGPKDNLIIDPASKTATYDIKPNELNDIMIFGNVIDPTVDITLSLSTMTGTVKLVEGKATPAFTLNTGAGDITLPATTFNDETNISNGSNVRADSDGIITINLSAADGSVIVPANGDTELTFDADGVYTGDIAVIKSPAAAIRRAPLTAGKWYYNVGEGKTYDRLDFRFDLVNKKVEFISEYHANNLYAVAAAENAVITDVDAVNGGTLKHNGDGTFSAKVHVDEGEKLYIVRRNYGGYIRNGYGSGLSPQVVNSRTIDFNSEEVDIPVLPSTAEPCYGWSIENNPGCDVMVHYNPATLMLHLDMDLAGVEDVTVDGICGDSEPIYYNLQGVRVTNPESGHIYIELRGNKARKIVK